MDLLLIEIKHWSTQNPPKRWRVPAKIVASIRHRTFQRTRPWLTVATISLSEVGPIKTPLRSSAPLLLQRWVERRGIERDDWRNARDRASRHLAEQRVADRGSC
jgi:hypothetical protein